MQGATIYNITVALSDVDRGVYETLELRMARHPSESMRFLVTRLFAYALSYEEGIAFSKGGISSTDEPPVSIRDLTGVLVAWIDVGSPTAARLHKATKAAKRVSLFTCADVSYLSREDDSPQGRNRRDVFAIASFVDTFAERIDRRTEIEIVRTGGAIVRDDRLASFSKARRWRSGWTRGKVNRVDPQDGFGDTPSRKSTRRCSMGCACATSTSASRPTSRRCSFSTGSRRASKSTKSSSPRCALSTAA